jgi:ubiquinone/menaquinone biosynthesis C-methylase UbiE
MLAMSAMRQCEQSIRRSKNKNQELGMVEELVFKDEAATEYDRAFAHVTAHFMPFLLRAAHIAPGMRVLDIVTGTGLSAEAALAAVGHTGHVTAADVSPAMPRKRVNVLAKWRTGKRFRSRIAVSISYCAISG